MIWRRKPRLDGCTCDEIGNTGSHFSGCPWAVYQPTRFNGEDQIDVEHLWREQAIASGQLLMPGKPLRRRKDRRA